MSQDNTDTMETETKNGTEAEDVADAEASTDTETSTDTKIETKVDTGSEYILDITPEALEKVMGIRSGEEESENMGLRVEITGHKGVDFTYDLSFQSTTESKDTDTIYEIESLPMIIPEETVERLTGSTLDLPANSGQGGLIIRNPNRPNLVEGMSFELTGSIAEKVQQLLEQQINPSLAVHGGYAQLSHVDDTVVYLTMGGGCHGCSMSAMTLREGITVMIGQAIPEVTDVVDVTDHDTGENPYFQ